MRVLGYVRVSTEEQGGGRGRAHERAKTYRSAGCYLPNTGPRCCQW
jgi:DNA invertase Pin-like site-specific DNA recombinase